VHCYKSAKVRSYALLDQREVSVEFPVLLHLGAMDYHSSIDTGNSIQLFFNECWKSKHKNDCFMFNSNNYPTICPIGKKV
jgi:hypothetical protein